MHLCFGTFATTLNCCKNKKVSQPNLVAAIVGCIDPGSRYITDVDLSNKRSTAKHLLSCDYSFSFSDRASESDSPTETVAGKIESSVLPLLRQDMYATMLLALLEIICIDESIDSEHKEDFKKFFGLSKKDLFKKTTFHLPTFLSQMLLYTTCRNIENKAGKPFIKKITADYIKDITENSWCELKYVSETQSVTLIPTEEMRLWKEIDTLSQLKLASMDDPKYQMPTDMTWLGISKCELFPNIYPSISLKDPKAKKEVSDKILQYMKTLRKFTEALINDSDGTGKLMYPALPDEELKALRQRLTNLFNEIFRLALFPNLFVSGQNDTE